ncbi:MAG: intermembrane phospholipid transport protein YdbH family protein [bacterium]
MSKKTLLKWLVVLFTFLALCFVAIGIIQSVVLPQWLANEIQQALAQRGLQEVSLSFDRLGLYHASLKDVQIGNRDSLFVGEIAIDYDPQALRQRRVRAIEVKNAYLAVTIKDGKMNLGPLASYTSPGPIILPFEILKLSDCKLRVDWEGLILLVPFEAEITPLGPDSVDIVLHAKLQKGALRLQSSVDIASLSGAGKISLSEIDAGILQHLRGRYLPNYALHTSGHWDAELRFVQQHELWSLQGMLRGDSLHASYLPAGLNHTLTIERLQADLDLHSDSLCTVTLRSEINQIATTLNAALDPKTRQVSGGFTLPNTRLEVLQPWIDDLASPMTLTGNGQLALSGRYSINAEQRGWVRLSLRGHQISAHASGPSFHPKLLLQTINGEAELTIAKQRTVLTNAEVQIQGMHIAEDSLGIAMSEVEIKLPVDWQRQTISNGEFSIPNARWHEFKLSALTGDLQWENQRLNFSGSSVLFENARLDFSGWLDHTQEKITGELSANVPPFTLQNSAALSPLSPQLRDYTISGVFALTSRVQMKEDDFHPFLRLETQNVSWQSKQTEARLDGISGTLSLDDLEPLTSAGEQHFTFASASFGDFDVTKGEVLLHIANRDSLLIKSLSCSWAGGKLSSNNILVQPSTTQIKFILHAEALDLQAILDFVRYQGVKGQGKIYGELPVTLNWGDKKRLALGDGYLEARPQAGVLQLSPENAHALLGIQKPIDPKNASLEDQVSLMVINALQDMAYTNLRIEFKNEPGRGLMTYVRAQGYGPRHDQEKQIPIGGFNVNINHLDDLLNSMIWPHMSAGKVKLE